MTNQFNNINLYELLNIDVQAKDDEIRKAYRKKALSCHPDKNPDPKAAELFHELSKALEILSDVAARKAYDRVLIAKQAAEIRHKQLDSKRQKFKEDLEERERLATNQKPFKSSSNSGAYSVNCTPEEILQKEIERIRNEHSRLLEEQLHIMKKQLLEERDKLLKATQKSQSNTEFHRLKLRWNAEKSDKSNGGYNEDLLRKYFQKYDDITALIMSKKNGSALIEFRTENGAEMAVAYEKGLLNNPLRLEWIASSSSSSSSSTTGHPFSGNKHKNKLNPTAATTITANDYESLVLREMRQAEERKKLIQKLNAQESC